MKTTLIAVISLNGKITKGESSNVHSWTSKEDQSFFADMMKKNNLVIMGRNTYDIVKNKIDFKENKLRIVLTKTPKKYKNFKDKLKFSNEKPSDLIQKLEKKGFKKALIVGGSSIYTLFLKENLIDEMFLTIEPKIFGYGKPFITEKLNERNLKLISFRKLNKKGTVLLHYKII